MSSTGARAARITGADEVRGRRRAGAITDLTRDHAAVAAAVRGITGTEPANDWRHFLTWREAVACERRDRVTVKAAIDRECNDNRCPDELATQAREIRMAGRTHAESILRALGTIVEQLGTITAPKHLVLISAGIPFDEESIVRYRDLADRAARSHVALFIVQLDQADFDASSRGLHAQIFGGREHADGLANIASVTGGEFLGAVGHAGGVFDRINAGIRYFYELGVESRAPDADGRPHKVDVRVAPGDHRALQPGDHGARVVGQRSDGRQQEDRRSGERHRGGYVCAMVVEWQRRRRPGQHRLRTAAVLDQRAATLEIPLSAELAAMGSALVSDLVVGTIADGRIEPASRLSREAIAVAMLE